MTVILLCPRNPAVSDKAGLLAENAASAGGHTFSSNAQWSLCRNTFITVMAVAPDSHRLPFSPGPVQKKSLSSEPPDTVSYYSVVGYLMQILPYGTDTVNDIHLHVEAGMQRS